MGQRGKEIFRTKLVGVVVTKINGGHLSVSVRQIANWYTQEHGHYPMRALERDIRERLKRIRKDLEELGLPTVLVNERYFEKYSGKTQPTTQKDALASLRCSKTCPAGGLFYCHTNDSPMLEMSLRNGFRCAGGKAQKVANRLLDAVDKNKIRSDKAKRMIQEFDRVSSPKDLFLLDEVMATHGLAGLNQTRTRDE